MAMLKLLGIPVLIWILLSVLGEKFFELDNDDEAGLLVIVFGSLAIVMISFCIVMGGFNNDKFKTYELYSTQNIVALQDNQTYIISRYSTTDTLQYYYMIDNNGAYTSSNIPQNETTIYQNNNVTPEIKTYKTKFTNCILQWYLGDAYYDYKYEIYVPRGTISQQYNVDLK